MSHVIVGQSLVKKLVVTLGYKIGCNIFLLEVNFDKSIIRLQLLLISFMVANRKLKIKSYFINKFFKFQVFGVLNYA